VNIVYLKLRRQKGADRLNNCPGIIAAAKTGTRMNENNVLSGASDVLIKG